MVVVNSKFRVLNFEGYPVFTGAQRAMAALMSNLGEEFDVANVCCDDGEIASGYRQQGLGMEIVRAPAILRQYHRALHNRGPWYSARIVLEGLVPYTLRLTQLFHRWGPHVVHCNDARGVVLAAPAARLAAAPVIWYLHGANDLDGTLNRAVHSMADAIIAVSSRITDTLLPSGRDKCVVIPYGIPRIQIDRSSVERARAWLAREKTRRQLDADAAVILTASTVYPQKGLHHLLYALKTIVTRQPSYRGRLMWLVLGDYEEPLAGRYRAELDALAGIRPDLSRNMVWLGWQRDPEVWMEAADIVVVPSVGSETFERSSGERVQIASTEGQPRVVAEAMAVGKPVIASAISGIGEQIRDGETGYLVPPGDNRAIAERLLGYLETPVKGRSVGESAKLEARTRSMASMAEQVGSVYRSMASGRLNTR